MASNNLNKFKPGNTAAAGNTGNRGQRSSRMCTQTIISILNEPGKVVQFEGDRKSKLYEICDSLVDNARNGDFQAQKYIMDRVDGAPTQMMGEDPERPMKRPVFVVGVESAADGTTRVMVSSADAPALPPDDSQ